MEYQNMSSDIVRTTSFTVPIIPPSSHLKPQSFIRCPVYLSNYQAKKIIEGKINKYKEAYSNQDLSYEERLHSPERRKAMLTNNLPIQISRIYSASLKKKKKILLGGLQNNQEEQLFTLKANEETLDNRSTIINTSKSSQINRGKLKDFQFPSTKNESSFIIKQLSYQYDKSFLQKNQEKISSQGKSINSQDEIALITNEDILKAQKKNKILFSRKSILRQKSFNLNKFGILNDDDLNSEQMLDSSRTNKFKSQNSVECKRNLSQINQNNNDNYEVKDNQIQLSNSILSNQQLSNINPINYETIIYDKIIPFSFKITSSRERIPSPLPDINQNNNIANAKKDLSSPYQEEYLAKFSSLKSDEREPAAQCLKREIRSSNFYQKKQNKTIDSLKSAQHCGNKLNDVHYKFELVHFQDFNVSPQKTSQTSNITQKLSKRSSFPHNKIIRPII